MGLFSGQEAGALGCEGVVSIHSLPYSSVPSLLPSLSGSSSSVWAFTLLLDTKLEILGALGPSQAISGCLM